MLNGKSHSEANIESLNHAEYRPKLTTKSKAQSSRRIHNFDFALPTLSPSCRRIIIHRALGISRVFVFIAGASTPWMAVVKRPSALHHLQRNKSIARFSE